MHLPYFLDSTNLVVGIYFTAYTYMKYEFTSAYWTKYQSITKLLLVIESQKLSHHCHTCHSLLWSKISLSIKMHHLQYHQGHCQFHISWETWQLSPVSLTLKTFSPINTPVKLLVISSFRHHIIIWCHHSVGPLLTYKCFKERFVNWDFQQLQLVSKASQYNGLCV
jgi:hypothetical protein